MGELNVVTLDQSFTWLDAGTEDSLLSSALTIQKLQAEQGRYVGCIEEIAMENGWIDKVQLGWLAEEQSKTKYGKYLAGCAR